MNFKIPEGRRLTIYGRYVIGKTIKRKNDLRFEGVSSTVKIVSIVAREDGTVVMATEGIDGHSIGLEIVGRWKK